MNLMWYVYHLATSGVVLQIIFALVMPIYGNVILLHSFNVFAGAWWEVQGVL